MTTEMSKMVDIAPNLSPEQFNKLAKSSNFLPRCQLFQSVSKAVKQRKIEQGHWGLVKGKDDVTDLGEQFDVLVIQSRSKALDTSVEKPIQYFNQESPEFLDVVDRSSEADSGCMWGPEFLVWVPRFSTFATIFFSSVTLRNSADEFQQLQGYPATLGSRFIETKKHSWHGPTVSMCSTPFTNVPDRAVVIQQNERFCKPAAAEEVVEDDTDETVGEDRAR